MDFLSYSSSSSPALTSDSDVSFDYQLPISPPVLPTTNIALPALNYHHHRDHPHRRRPDIPHPYARLFAKKDEVKRRKIWNHALEKSIFTPYELSTKGAPQRRAIYIASLEAHIDKLHARLLELGFFPVEFSELDPFKGLNSKTAKSMVAGLQHDATVSKLKLLELERANNDLEKRLNSTSVPVTTYTSHAYGHGKSITLTSVSNPLCTMNCQ